MRKFLTLIACVAVFSGPVSAQKSCYACSIYDEYGIQGIGIGYNYLNWDGRRVTVHAVDRARAMVLVSPAGYTNPRSWITASSLYTDQRWNERLNRQNQGGVAAACAMYQRALRDGNMMTAWLMRRGCCESTTARQNGLPAICRN